jgi:hypothetical protein
MSSLDLTEANSSGTPGVKPTDRDDLADKVNEPSNTKLDDYSDPNAVIASILSDSNGRRCDTWQTVEKNDGIFTRIHGVFRKALTHPADIMKNVEHLRPMRLTCGTYSNGEDFSIFDSWKTSHHKLKLPWTGTTTYFDRQCNVDDHIDRLYNLKSSHRPV